MNILGLVIGECSSAALFSNNELITAASEERFKGIKEYSGYPQQAIEFCLKTAGIQPGELDTVAVSSTRVKQFTTLLQRRSTFSVQDYLKEFYEYWRPILIERKKVRYLDVFKDRIRDDVYSKEVKNLILASHPDEVREANQLIRKMIIQEHLSIPDAKIVFIDHHTCHAFYGKYGMDTGSKPLIVLTYDSSGDGINATVNIFENDKRREIFRTSEFNLGRMWQYATLLLGMKPHEHEYKVMGLAPYASSYLTKKALNVYESTMYVDGLDFKYRERPTDFYEWFKLRLEGIRFDGIAGGLQKYTEDILTTWVKNIVKTTGIHRMSLSGGIAMNIKANQVLNALPEIEELYVPASPDDHTLSVGACYAIASSAYQNQKLSKLYPLRSAYLGPDVSQYEVNEVICELKDRAGYEILPHASPQVIAERLARGKIIGRCAGRMELGARALGNRSILADPRDPNIVARVNKAIKMRDFWMPFAPAILEEDALYFLETEELPHMPYMMIGFQIRPEHRKDVPAVIHPYDSSCRPQVLRQKDSESFWNIVKAFKDLTGIGVVLNTSFNLHGEPIVLGPKEALRVFIQSSLDGLLLNETYIEKTKACS